MVDPADIQLNLDNDQAGQVVQQNIPASAQTTLTFEVEQSKVLRTESEEHCHSNCIHQKDRQLGKDQQLE